MPALAQNIGFDMAGQFWEQEGQFHAVEECAIGHAVPQGQEIGKGWIRHWI
jgi:hypothetical protein